MNYWLALIAALIFPPLFIVYGLIGLGFWIFIKWLDSGPKLNH